MNWPPITMATQHPDNASRPWWHADPFISTQDELEEMLLARSIAISCETVRHWGIKFGADFWHLDKVAIAMDGGKRWRGLA